MKKRLTHVDVLQCGIVLGVLYACLSLVFIPFFLIGFLLPAAAGAHPAGPFGLGIVFVVIFPILYGILGFIGGIIAAAIYNLVAKMTGGIEFITVAAPSAVASDPLLD